MLRLWQTLLLSVALGVVSLWLVLPNASFSEVRTALATIDLRLVPAIVAAIVGWWLLAGLRNRMLCVRIGTPISLLQAVQTHVFGVFSSAVTPAGAGSSFGIAFMLMRSGLSAENAAAATVMTLVGDMTFFAWSVPLSLLLLTRSELALPIDNLALYALGLTTLALAASYLLVFRLPLAARLLTRLARLPLLHRFQGRIERFLERLGLASERYATVPWSWHLGFVALSSLGRVMYFAIFNLIVLAFDLDIGQLIVYAIQTVIHAFAFAIPTPGASGYQELAMSFALKGQVSTGSLSAVIVLWRLTNYYFYLLVGPLIGGMALLRALRRTGEVDGSTPG